MKKRYAGYLIILTLAIVARFAVTGNPGAPETSPERALAPVALPKPQEAGATVNVPLTPAASVTPVSAASPAGSPAESIDPELAAALGEFSKLKQRVLLNDESAAAKSRLVHDEALLEKTRTIFVSASAQEESLRNAAIDLLLEARTTAKSEAAEVVLRSLIEDPRIEKTEVEYSVRAELAEIKAEVMYRWSAQEPERAADIAKWLPGPVSGKIWNNVLNAQKQNRLESMMEAANYH